ncbi:helix-turn-helix domain-containing protein [Thermostaphylospora chromogena]|uniref:AraC-type DNA-binding protein n=1 Tax=Thermostaphylospora chromogena TaxID=35622 RepID=A0A1H0ZS65_9ACTN|nr:helix-turn-helix transcriptional regulator [Thermostaphylospora chromogena]SDQ30248.1 AraC-type DNA-binding protein [Thermostaphylospora chromogena]
MDDVIERAVRRVIEEMQKNHGEQLTIDDMARTAMFSKFHFSRVFQRVTGLSPGRFLAAVRLREAKRLLASTSLSITHISHQVGYSSVGTFSSRFTRSVGLSPSKYRQLMSVTEQDLAGARTPASAGPTTTLHGTVTSPLPDRPVFVGLFPGQILEGRPAGYALIRRPGPYIMEGAPQGHWYLIAQSVAESREDAVHHPPDGDGALCISRQPITVGPGGGTLRADIRLKPMSILDPPVLLALRDLLSAWDAEARGR